MASLKDLWWERSNFATTLTLGTFRLRKREGREMREKGEERESAKERNEGEGLLVRLGYWVM